METKVIAQTSAESQKSITDAKTRELNLKAKSVAKEDMKLEKTKPVRNNTTGKVVEFDVEANAVGVKQHDKPTQPKPKPPKEPRVTIAGKLDEIIKAGGKWEDLVLMAQEANNKLGGRLKFSKGALKAHIRFRLVTQKQSDYLGNKEITDEGIIEKVTTKAKGKK